MKYAILSDIHANLEAFDVVLEFCRHEGVGQYISLGDTVGYGANPMECLDRLRSLSPLAVVKGNHDEYASNNDEVMEGFNPHARAAVLWTKTQLTPEGRNYLANLPMRMTPRNSNFTVVHATLDSPDTWGYIFDVHHAADNFSYQFTPICFCGHSHVPLAFAKKPITLHAERSIEEIPEWAGSGIITPEQALQQESIVLKMEPGFKYLINVGSVGQPRNRDPRASFVIFDSIERVLTRYMLPYDIQTTQEKIREAGLPERLANRLGIGS